MESGTTDYQLPDDIKSFVARHVESVEAIETLLFLFRNRENDWSAEEVSKALYSTANSISLRLKTFHKKGFLSVLASAPRYRYAPVSEPLNEQVTRLAQLYPIYRLRIIDLIYSGRRKGFESLADAFVFRKEGENG